MPPFETLGPLLEPGHHLLAEGGVYWPQGPEGAAWLDFRSPDLERTWQAGTTPDTTFVVDGAPVSEQEFFRRYGDYWGVIAVDVVETGVISRIEIETHAHMANKRVQQTAEDVD